MYARDWLIAGGCYTALALALTGSALAGRTALAPEGMLEFDPLTRLERDIPLPIRGDFTPVLADLPRDLAVAGQLRHGHLAEWNPLSACGAPLWAEQGGPFFPLKLPFYLAPSRGTYSLFLMLRLIVAGLGAFALARQHGLAPLPAIAAGAFFELSGSLIEQLPFGCYSPTCLLPWALLGAGAIADQRTPRAAATAAIALGLAGNGGHPTIAASVFVAFALAVLAHAVVQRSDLSRTVATVRCGALALALGIALSAPSLLPTLELAAHGVSYKNAPQASALLALMAGESRATAPLALLAPALLQRMYAGVGPLFEAMATVGVLGLTLAVAGVIGRGLDLPLAAVAALGVLIGVSPPWIQSVPALRLFAPYYGWPLVVLPLTQAAAAGLDRIARGVGTRTAPVAFALVAAALAALLWLGPTDAPVGGATLGRRFDAEWQTAAGRAAALLPAAVALAALGAAALLRRGVGRVSAAACVAAVGVGELLLLWWPVVHQPLARVPATAPGIAFLQSRLGDGEGRMLGVPFWVGAPLTPMRYGLADFRGLSALPVRRFHHYLTLVDPRAGWNTLLGPQARRSPLLDLAAVRYVAVSRTAAAADTILEADPHLPLAYADDHVAIYENRAALPRVRIAHTSEAVADAAAATARLRALSAGASHAAATPLTETVVIEPDERGGLPPPLASPVAGGEWARLVAEAEPDALAIDVQLVQPGLVVLADTFYPGWRAWVDDVPTPIYPANLLFRAVHVPAGRHRIRMRYASRAARYGVLLGGAAVLVCAVLLWRRPVARSA